MYEIIENGVRNLCTADEAATIIAAFNERNHIVSLDEFWKMQKVIYLQDKVFETERNTMELSRFLTRDELAQAKDIAATRTHKIYAGGYYCSREPLHTMVIGSADAETTARYLRPNLMIEDNSSRFLVTTDMETAKLLATQSDACRVLDFTGSGAFPFCAYDPIHYLTDITSAADMANILLQHPCAKRLNSDPFYAIAIRKVLATLLYDAARDGSNLSTAYQRLTQLFIFPDLSRKTIDVIKPCLTTLLAPYTMRPLLMVDSVNLSGFVNSTTPQSFVVLLPVSDSTYDNIAAVLVTQLLTLLSNRTKHTEGCYVKLFLADADRLHIPSLTRSLSVSGQLHYSVDMIWQSLTSFKAQCPKDAILLLSLCNLVVYGCTDLEDAAYYSLRCGRVYKGLFKKHTVPLLTEGQVLALPQEQCLVFESGLRPYLGKKPDGVYLPAQPQLHAV